MTRSADEFFGGAAGLSWPKANNGVYTDTRLRGVVRGGRITTEPTVQQMTEPGSGRPLTWPDGRPKEQLVVELLCDGSGRPVGPGGQVLPVLDERDRSVPSDDGKRRLYVRGYMTPAIREALQKVGASGLRVGGELYVAWVDEKPSKTKGFDPARVWAAMYVPPTTPVPDGGAASQPQQGLSGAPANPFGQAVQDGQQQAAQLVQAAQQMGYQGPAYQPPQAAPPAGDPFGGPSQQQPAQTAVAANPFG